MKDNFSSHSDQYARYRPTYPKELFEFIYGHVPEKIAAWDCGTGNGQIAIELSAAFHHIYATDISAQQLAHATKAGNISYSVQPAEHTSFPDRIFDLIVVAQAIHWFDFGRFYQEVNRTAKPGALLCITGYGNIELPQILKEIVYDFYEGVTGPYWDAERRYIDEGYQTIPFPFREIAVPKLVNTLYWTQQELIGYINTWSGLKNFIKQKGHNPIEQLTSSIAEHWGVHERIEVTFPILLRAAVID